MNPRRKPWRERIYDFASWLADEPRAAEGAPKRPRDYVSAFVLIGILATCVVIVAVGLLLGWG